ncbi:hypothetical protein [Runella rosea]|nr:hypothetical protein [Runella rosea]
MNLINAFRYNLKKEISITQEELLLTKQKLKITQQELLYFKILNYYETNSNDKYKNELIFLKDIGCISLFPYRQIRKLEDVIVGFDDNKRMPFVIHNGDRLYFPESWSLSQVKENYISLIEEQSILGGNFLEKSPHQYQTESFCVNKGDIVLDIGAAEALFALEVINLAAKVYIFESEKMWAKPLEATFEPYKNKVVIINKMVSGVDSENEITLETALVNEKAKSLFLKLDIEGSESLVLEANMNLLNKDIDIKVACCTYHKNEDEEYLKFFFDQIGYKSEFSDGFMIYVHDENIRPPYFRKGLIRAQN